MVQLSVQDITRESKVSQYEHIREKKDHKMQFDHSYDLFWTVPSDLLHNCQSRMGGSFHLLHPGPPQTRHRHSSNCFLRETLLLASEGEVVFRS